MKRILLLFGFVMILFSCQKESSPNTPTGTLDGKWRMVIVKDNATGSVLPKPANVIGDVDITFASTGSTTGIFFGYTPYNTIQSSAYTFDAGQALHVLYIDTTKFGEPPPWGPSFYNNFLDSQYYYFDTDGRLNVVTINKTLIFQRL